MCSKEKQSKEEILTKSDKITKELAATKVKAIDDLKKRNKKNFKYNLIKQSRYVKKKINGRNCLVKKKRKRNIISKE